MLIVGYNFKKALSRAVFLTFCLARVIWLLSLGDIQFFLFQRFVLLILIFLLKHKI